MIDYLDELAAKVAAHAADCYKEAYTSAKTENAKKVIPDVRKSNFVFFVREFDFSRISSEQCLPSIYCSNRKRNFMLVNKPKVIENMVLQLFDLM
jgi:hypothetical protein